jgi:enolase-phosphatase E1
MKLNLNDPSLKCVLLDVEGTTTPIDFVYKTLFPFARANVKDYLNRNWSSAEVEADLAQLRAEHSKDCAEGLLPPPMLTPMAASGTEAMTEQVESVASYLHWLMDRDRKSTPLKSIQGRIWEEGYRSGALLSQVFEDVPPAFARWRQWNKLICIYSSGSVLAQRLLFGHTAYGDLTEFISRYFDTTIGHKVDSGSYQRIADALRLAPSEIIFASDVVAELDAARAAGMKTILTVRPGDRLAQPAGAQVTVNSFAEL